RLISSVCTLIPRLPRSSLVPYTPLFRSCSAPLYISGRSPGWPGPPWGLGGNCCPAVFSALRSTQDHHKHLLKRSPYSVFSNLSGDRKSTRLNSSHVKFSYAGFCWKKINK